MTIRCPWAAGGNEAMQAYHDTEWGVPLHDDRALFELLTLEGAQAGLSWHAVLMRRPYYRQSFHDFDIDRVAAMTDAELEALLAGAGIIRNRQKIWSVRDNARATQAVRQRDGSLDTFLWRFVDGTPVVNRFTEPSQVPATTPLSDHLSKTLRKLGFRFVGPTICYAFMQASGMVNDHLTTCFRHGQP
ncbi:MAG: DNA-3-methyladenine glycosylase I [Acetobacteraceae bacterium]